jgi:hypothetical protein
MSGSLSLVKLAYVAYCNAMLFIGLLINTHESELFIPQWRQIPVNILQAHHPSIQLTPAPIRGPLCVGYAMPNHDHIPLTWVGLKVLGCPLVPVNSAAPTPTKSSPTSALIWTFLSQFPALHQRTKLAIYCSNARISYLLRAPPLDLFLDLMPSLDTFFDRFMEVTVSSEPAYAQSPAAAQYRKILQQLQLRIQDGSIGLTSAALVAPAASYVALREFLNWYCAHATLWGGLTSTISHGILSAPPLQLPLPMSFPTSLTHLTRQLLR